MHVKTTNKIIEENWGREIINIYLHWNLFVLEHWSYTSTLLGIWNMFLKQFFIQGFMCFRLIRDLQCVYVWSQGWLLVPLSQPLKC